jgi:hypothetical protein
LYLKVPTTSGKAVVSHERIDPDERLVASRDRQVGLRLPFAIDQRLDALLARAVEAGERTTRRELLAAIILSTELSGDDLGGLLRAYRRANVRDALLDARQDNVAYLSHKPGPRVVR